MKEEGIGWGLRDALKVLISNSPHCTGCPHQGLEAANEGAKIRTPQPSLPPTSTMGAKGEKKEIKRGEERTGRERGERQRKEERERRERGKREIRGDSSERGERWRVLTSLVFNLH